MNEIRRTKIIATIGPASEKEEVMRDMMLAGMNLSLIHIFLCEDLPKL